MMLERFKHYVDEQHLFSPEQEVLLAVSGGRDSVAMAHLMHRAGFRFAMAHCNFHLRGEESNRDQSFVEALAARLGVHCHTVQFDTAAHARTTGESIEEAARTLRYGWFSDVCARYGYSCLATAHHLDDSVETFFLNLLRGTGIAGLHGIRPSARLHGLAVVRPMLCFSRAEIDAYVVRHSLRYVDDSTNAELAARRNRLRLRLMPLLRDICPSFLDTMAANIARLHDAELVYDSRLVELRAALVRPLPSVVPGVECRFECVDIGGIPPELPRRTVLFELLRPYGFSASVAESVLGGSMRTGAVFESRTHEATLHRGQLVLGPRMVSAPTVRLDVQSAGSNAASAASVAAGGRAVVVDAEKVALPLALRPWQPGDRFCPFGMQQSRLVSDFLKDLKLHRLEKKQVQVVVDAEGRIVWVAGLRADNRFRLSPDSREALAVRLVAEGV